MRPAVPGRWAPGYSPRMAAAQRLHVNNPAVSVQHAFAHDSTLFPLQGQRVHGQGSFKTKHQEMRATVSLISSFPKSREENQNEEAIQGLVFCNSGIDAFNRSITGSCFPIQHRNAVASLKLDRWRPEPGICLVCLSAGQSISIYRLKGGAGFQPLGLGTK